MRKFIILGLISAIAAPTAVAAQSRAEVRRGQQDLREEQRQLQGARQFGDLRDVREEQRDVQEARQELREDRRDMQEDRRERRGDGDRRQAYVAPYRGWTYRPVSSGFRLQPGFYGQRYIVANPGQYRLRPASRNQQWIRYGNDLLLVNIRSGRVVHVVRSRF